MTTLNQNFFNAFDSQLDAKALVILDLERKIAELQEELKDAKVLKQQYLSVDAIAKSSIEQLKNAIESINYAYHTIGTQEMGEAFVLEFQQNVISELEHLRESPTISDIPLLESTEAVESKYSKTPNPGPSDELMKDAEFLLKDAEIVTTDPLTTIKSVIGSSTNETLEAIIKFYDSTKVNALKPTPYHEMSLNDLKKHAVSIKKETLKDLTTVIKKKFGVTNKVGFLLYVLSPDWAI